VGHVFETKMVTFVMDQGSKMDAFSKAMKTPVASCTELFPIMVESSEDGEISSSYSDLIAHDVMEIQGAAAGGGNQLMEEEDQVEDITALMAPPISAIKVVDPNAIPVSSTIGKKTLDGCHVAKVTPLSPRLIFHVVCRAPPPLASFAPGFPRDNQLAAPLAPDFAETGDHIGVIPGSNGHEVPAAPPRAPFLAMDRASCSKKQKQKKKETKLKKLKAKE
jgi:hypothetical protein